MTSASMIESVRRFRDILALVSRSQVRTAYEVAARLKLPVSSTYNAIAELERLSCLTRDEAGFLLVGARPQQIALDAMGFRVSAQRLAPLVRYLRDQTGETVFTASMTEMLTVGVFAIGFNPGSLPIEPFQQYRLVDRPAQLHPSEAFQLTLTSERDYGVTDEYVSLMGVPLARSIQNPGKVLIIGAARYVEFSNPRHVSRKLVESKIFFDRSQA